MTRILFTLGSMSLLLMGAALVLGLSIGNLYDNPTDATLRLATVHRLTGVAAALTVVLVESIVVTYFIGTSRWCREVVEAYRLDPQIAAASAQLKRRAFPWAMAGMLAVIGVSALGAAGDPGSGRVGTETWATVHLIAAIAGFAFVAWTYVVAYQRIYENQQLIAQLIEAEARRRSKPQDGQSDSGAGAPLTVGGDSTN